MPIKSWEEFKSDARELFSWSNIRANGALWFFRNFINLIDDPIDYLKEKVHGYEFTIYGKTYEINIAILMCNRGKPYWPIIRPKGDYPNENPKEKE